MSKQDLIDKMIEYGRFLDGQPVVNPCYLVYFDGENVVTKQISEEEFYGPSLPDLVDEEGK